MLLQAPESFPLSAFSPLTSPGFSWALLENIFIRAASLSLFQFDGESAYVGMSDGNPELLSTSQVGAPSSLSSLGLAGAKLLPGWDGRGAEQVAQPTVVLS